MKHWGKRFLADGLVKTLGFEKSRDVSRFPLSLCRGTGRKRPATNGLISLASASFAPMQKGAPKFRRLLAWVTQVFSESAEHNIPRIYKPLSPRSDLGKKMSGQKKRPLALKSQVAFSGGAGTPYTKLDTALKGRLNRLQYSMLRFLWPPSIRCRPRMKSDTKSDTPLGRRIRSHEGEFTPPSSPPRTTPSAHHRRTQSPSNRAGPRTCTAEWTRFPILG